MWPFSEIKRLWREFHALANDVQELKDEIRLIHRGLRTMEIEFPEVRNAVLATRTNSHDGSSCNLIMKPNEVDDRLKELYDHLGVGRVTTPETTKLVKKIAKK